jgi:hypothetical protein
MIDLNKEAENYCNNNYPNYLNKKEALLVQEDFIAGTNSKYVQAKIVQAQINLCNSALDLSNEIDETSNYLKRQLSLLRQQLKELENG